LRAGGAAYPCACTRRDLESAPVGAGGERVYPGTCRSGIPPARRTRETPAWRIRVDALGGTAVSFVDRLQGPQAQELARDVGDFVVKRADGLFAYQLAVVVDDAWQGVTDVVRGADLLASTARQVWLQRLLGYPTPTYLHVPVAIDAAGAKLSKQTRAAPLPADPMPALLSAWRFLDQTLPPGTAAPVSVAEFWVWARQVWKPHRLPPVVMLPAPAGAGAGSAAG
jgi:glutamyl-Q tRNA(Asp) synthetase